MNERTVIVLQDSHGAVLRTFTVQTAQINDRDKKDIVELAGKYNQFVHFFPVAGWSGIESVKWDIKEMNGATDSEEEAKKISQNAAKGRTTWGGGMD